MDGSEMLAISDYRTSAEVNEIFAALAKAQGEIKNAAKDSENPHFRSKYADLASVSGACKAPLSKNGIAVIQIPHNEAEAIAVTTILGHSSGQWISGTLKAAPAKWDAQGVGSVTTYLRRYALAAMAGVAPGDDDDGEAAVGRGNGVTPLMAAPASRATGGARNAAPKPKADEPAEVRDAREKWKTIAARIDAAPKGEIVQQVLDDAKADLDFIRTHAGAEVALSLATRAEDRKRDLLGMRMQ